MRVPSVHRAVNRPSSEKVTNTRWNIFACNTVPLVAVLGLRVHLTSPFQQPMFDSFSVLRQTKFKVRGVEPDNCEEEASGCKEHRKLHCVAVKSLKTILHIFCTTYRFIIPLYQPIFRHCSLSDLNAGKSSGQRRQERVTLQGLQWSAGGSPRIISAGKKHAFAIKTLPNDLGPSCRQCNDSPSADSRLFSR